MSANETYIGDGVYVSFDGWSVILRAPRTGGDHWIYLGPNEYAAFNDEVKLMVSEKWKAAS